VLVELVVVALAVSVVVCEVETIGPVTEAVGVTELVELLGVTELVELLALLTMIVLSLDLDDVEDSLTVAEDDVVVLEDRTGVVLRVENE
jgi:hypothetical protein